MAETISKPTIKPTRVLIVDDFPGFRQCVRDLLGEYPAFEVVGEAEDGVMAMQMAESLRPDVVLMDVHISRIDGVTATRQIKALLPLTSIIGLSAIPTPHAEKGMLEAGAGAFVQKERVYDQLLSALDKTMRGQREAQDPEEFG